MQNAADRNFRALRIAVCCLSAALPAAGAAAAEPTLVRVSGPQYPPGAVARGLTGTAECTILVSASGAVTGVEVQASDAGLEEAAKTAAMGFGFEPSPESSVVRIVFQFELEPGAGPIALPPAPFGRLRLHVAQAGTRAAVVGATAVAVGFGIGAVAGGKGDAALRLPAGELSILVAAPEYFPSQIRISVPTGGLVEETVYLYRSRPGEFSATVPGERRTDAPTRVQLDREELRNVPGTQDDPLRVVSLLPGVARAPFAGGQLVVRGARPTDTGAYLNGQRIPILYHVLDGPSVLAESAVESIDFLAGGAGVFYGNHLAAIVAVKPRFGDPDDLHGNAAIDLSKTSAWLEGPIGDRTQFSFGGRLSYVNPLLPANQQVLPPPLAGSTDADADFAS